ncbi:uncharacterized protein LOC121958104 [Plectropomus leopardus]|uniref:uncharacterized protein LOC121958104 n=1 Tax=Plectropomus leopardus TaxID=160734 RepID=UPI001C4A9EFE|nr:uncharacterized protein LOC121958104 [Plectropomus leopardus]
MTVNIFSCLLAFTLGCNVAAEIIREVVEEKQPVLLRCPRSVEGKVTWSREFRGSKVDILTADGDREERFSDPGKRYSSQADKFRSLYIKGTNASDSGRYLCNNEAAVELMVIPKGTKRHTAVIRADVTLRCPSDVSHRPTWTRKHGGEMIPFKDNPRGHVLNLTDVQPGDAGLYLCDGKPAAYLTVTEDQSERAAPLPVLVLEVLVPLLLVTFIILFLAWRYRISRRGSGEQRDETVYAEITDGSDFEPAQVGSNRQDFISSIFRDAPALGNNSGKDSRNLLC